MLEGLSTSVTNFPRICTKVVGKWDIPLFTALNPLTPNAKYARMVFFYFFV